MIDITNRTEIGELDSSNVLESINLLPEQIEDAWSETAHHQWQDYTQGVDHVVVAGMGGSALGAEVIKSLAKESLRVPLEIVKDYVLPGYINGNTLVILSSYSGTTEETLAAAETAQAKQARIAVITSGGPLAELATKLQCPAYIINPVHNPSKQPRMAIGYTITGLIGLLNSFGLIDSRNIDIRTTCDYLKAHKTFYQPENVNNLAVQLAQDSQEKIIYFVSAEHLAGATHVVNNQFNENAKHLTMELQLPELNHHYMEALPNPESVKTHCIFWLVNSSLYSDKLALRLKLTQDVIEKNDFETKLLNIEAHDHFTQVFELIQLGSYANFYLAMLHGINPAPIPWVDYFKGELQKSQLAS